MTDKPLDNQRDPLEVEIEKALAPAKDIQIDLDTEGLSAREAPALDIPMPNLSAPPEDPNEAKLRTESVLEGEGFDPETIGRTLNPNRNYPTSLEVARNYGVQTPESSTPEAESASRLMGQFDAEGKPLPESGWDNIQSLMMTASYNSVEGLAASRSWWMRSKKMFARAATPLMFFGAADFGIGMGLLDTFAWGQKKMKIGFTPKSQRAEVEKLLLPKVTVGGREYSNSATAALSLHRDRWWGALQVGAGAVLGVAGTVVPGPGQADVLEIARGLRAEGGRDWMQAMTEAPQIAATVGKQMGWHEIIERHYEETTDFSSDNYYAWLEQAGWKGKLLMGVVAVADVIPEVALDPLLWTGMAAQKVLPLARAGLAAVKPAAAARMTRTVARETQMYEDATDALRAAQNNLEKVELKILGRQASDEIPARALLTSETQISRQEAKELVQARTAVANEQMFFDTFHEGPKSDIIFRTPKRNPDFKPEVEETLEYLEVLPGVTKDGVFQPVWVKRTEVRNRFVDDLAEEMTLRRHAELERDADQVIYWDNLGETSDDVLRQQRALFGADDTEQAGDGINHMVRTGGQGIDDVTLTPSSAEYSIIPDQGQVPIRDWRAIDLANDATKAEREFLGAPIRNAAGEITGYRGGAASGQYSLEMSTKRTLSRQLDIAQRNYGHARRQGDKPKIQLFEDEIARIKASRDGMDTEALTAADKKFVDWLPAHGEGIQSSPERFNRWMAIAGDRAMRSIYPGGLHLNSLWDTKAGQVFSPLREPQRYYDTHAPGTWERIQGGYVNYERANRVWSEEMLEGGLSAGIIVRRGKFNPKRHFSEYQLDPKKNETMFDLLNTKPRSPEWDEAAKGADDAMMDFHWKVRERLDEAADAQGIRANFENDDAPYMTGYIRHFFTKDQFAGGARPPEYLGMSHQAEVFAGHLLHRNGNAGYPKDFWGAMELYGRSMNRSKHVQPVYDEILVAGQEIAERTGNPFNAVYGQDLVAQLQGRPALIGQRVDQWLGGAINSGGGTIWKPQAIERGLVGLTGLWWAGMLPGNPRYPLMQMVTGVSTTAGRFGLFRTMRGLTKQATREGQAESRAAGVYEQFEKVFESDFMRRFSKFLTEKGVSFGPLGIQTTATTEEFIRGATYHAAIDMHLTKLGISSWDEVVTVGQKQRIVWEALRASQEVNHMFGALGRSPVIAQTVGKGPAVASTQFLSFIPKQTEELVGQFNRNPGNLAMYMAMSGWMSRVSAQQLGMDLTDYVGLGYLPDSPSDLTSPGMDTLISGMDWVTAMDKGDREGAAQALEGLLGSIDSMIPMLVAWKTSSKSAGELLSGRTHNAKGEFQRPLEFGGQDFGIPRNAEGNIDVAAGLEAFGRAMGPQKTGDLSPGATEGVGGDLYSTITGARAIRENMFQRGKQAIIDDAKEFQFEAQTAITKLWHKIQDGDTEGAEEIENLLKWKYNIVFEPGNQLERKQWAQEVSWTLRALKDADDQLLIKVVNEIRNNGISLGN